MTPAISLCFPAYNEAENLPGLLARVNDFCVNTFPSFEILIVNDGSSDRSAQVLRELSITYPSLRVLTHKHNQGYGAAVKTGLMNAQGTLIFFSDADQQFDITELTRFIVALGDADTVIGYRAPRRDPFTRRAAAWVWNLLFHWFFRLPYRDVDCAFKLFRREALARADLATIVSSGAVFSPELLLRLQDTGTTIVELPVSHFPRQHGSPTGLRFAVVRRAFFDSVALWRRRHA